MPGPSAYCLGRNALREILCWRAGVSSARSASGNGGVQLSADDTEILAARLSLLA
jgi:hypothetical protein